MSDYESADERQANATWLAVANGIVGCGSTREAAIADYWEQVKQENSQ